MGKRHRSPSKTPCQAFQLLQFRFKSCLTLFSYPFYSGKGRESDRRDYGTSMLRLATKALFKGLRFILRLTTLGVYGPEMKIIYDFV